MFIWLASYPKSGNTLVRSLLSSYFFSKDGIFNLRLSDMLKVNFLIVFFIQLYHKILCLYG